MVDSYFFQSFPG